MLEGKRENLVLAFILFCSVAILVWIGPLKLPDAGDFVTLYAQSLALNQRQSLYAEEIQSQMITQQESTEISVPPSPYPPWYSILTFFLGLFPLQVSARVWFTCNTGMLIGAMILIMRNRPAQGQFFFLLGAVLFPPAIGLLIIGQATMPIFLGIALCIYAVREKKALLNGIGLSILTLKPHLGILPFFATILYSAGELKFFKRTVLWFISVFGGFLLASWIIEPHWISEITQAFERWRVLQQNIVLDTCSNMMIELFRLLRFEGWNFWQGIFSVILAAAILMWVSKSKGAGNIDSDLFLSFSVLLDLLAVPYARSYDYVLLLIPLAVGVGGGKSRMLRVTALIAYAFTFGVMATMIRDLQGRLLWIGAFLPLVPLVREIAKRRLRST